MKKQTLLPFFIFINFFLAAQPCTSDLFISEYGEGSSGNSKYIEIYNGTGTAVNLGDYQLWRIVNGGTWPEGTYNFTTAMLADGATIVVARDTLDVPGADEYASFCNWNGDDAVGLAKSGALIDAVGNSGPDPGTGWDVAGTTEATKDHIIIRKPSIVDPDTNWVSTAGTNPTDSQWEVAAYTTGQPASLGNHTIDCGAPLCSISISDLSTACDPATDSFYLIINVAGENGGPSYTRTFNGMDSTVAYNTVDTIGQFISDAAAYQVIAVDVDSTACMDTLDGFAPAPCFIPPVDCQLIITGVIDGPLAGGHPKAVELLATGNIPDLSAYGIGSANNGLGSDGEEFTFPAMTLDSNDFIYIAADSAGFRDFFGDDAHFISGILNINGDDAVELFCDGAAIDVFGDIDSSGTGQPWEYTDGWAYRCAEGPTTVFTVADWIYSGIDALDGDTTNATAATPFPTASYDGTGCPAAPCMITSIGEMVSDCDIATDSFTVAIAPTVINGTGFYEYSVNGVMATGSFMYEQNQVVDTFLSDGFSMYEIIVSDVDSTGCKDTLTVNAPGPCKRVTADSCTLVLTAVFDGPLPGGHPKGVEIFAADDIPDLAAYGIGTANNGDGSDGEEFIFPTLAVDSNDYLYIALDSAGFRDFFEFDADFISGTVNINGDDAIELFCNNEVIDVFGDIDSSGVGQPWEYTDSWAYRNCGTDADTTNFKLANWTFGGVDALDGDTTNATAMIPVPIGTYLSICPTPCNDTLTISSAAIDGTFEAMTLIETSGPVTVTDMTIFNAPTIDLNAEFEVTAGVVFETMGTGCN